MFVRKRMLKQSEIIQIVNEPIPTDNDDLTDIESEADENEVNVFDNILEELQDEAEQANNVTAEPSDVNEMVDDNFENEIPVQLPKQRILITEPVRKWRKKDRKTEPHDYEYHEGPVDEHFDRCNTPTDIFIRLCGPAFENICYQSNLYATQRDKVLSLKISELHAFIGINFIMGYVSLPSWKNYWSTSSDLSVPLISKTMPRKRFDDILTYLHVNDNSAKPAVCNDKLYKLRPLIDTMNTQFSELYDVTKCTSVDESMILFKGRSTLKQYNPMKPIKRGYKLWCLGDQKGFISKFMVYQGKDEHIDDDLISYGLGERVVLQLTKSFRGTGLTVYFDNYFTSLRLLERLKKENILACGTIRSSRKGLPQLAADKSLTRGSHDYRVSDTDLSVFKWMDNKSVMFASNFHGTEVSTVKRKQRDGSSVETACPMIVKDYNANMGGVDKADHLRALYNVNRKSRKWWHRLFWGIVDIAFINAYVIHNCMFPKMTVLQFRRAVAQGLLTTIDTGSKAGTKRKSSSLSPSAQQQPKRGKFSYSVPPDVRLGNRGCHWPIFLAKRGRCEQCSLNKIESRPFSVCKTCKVHLCIIEKRNCFAEYHNISID